MRINVAIPEAHVDAPVLDASLEAVTRLNEAMLERGEVPTFTRGLRYGVQWKPEPPGEEHFDHAKTVLQRKWGDCDDLAPWQAASLRHTNEDPQAKAIVYQSGPKRWHAVVQRGDGTIEDPSKRAGMGQPRGVVGAVVPLMHRPASDSSVVGGAYIVRPAIALRPFRGQWQARADLPWHWREHLDDKPTPTDYAMVSLHHDPVASTALTGAIEGVCELGMCAGFADPDHIDRLSAIADAVDGASYHDLVGIYGEDHAAAATALVGSFGSAFKKVARRAGRIAKGGLKLARPLVKYIPGVGPLADDALKLVESVAKQLGLPPAQAALLLKHGETFPAINYP